MSTHQTRSHKLRKAEDGRTERLIRYSMVLGCPICGPNSGCNQTNRGSKTKSWKDSRSKQWER